MSFDIKEGEKLALPQLYSRKGVRLGRIEQIKGEIRTIEKLISEKEKE